MDNRIHRKSHVVNRKKLLVRCLNTLLALLFAISFTASFTVATAESYTYNGPVYEIVDIHDTGIGLTQYWVYTGKLNYSTDAYRYLAKAIIRDITHNENTDKIIIDIVTDKEIIYFESNNSIQKYMDEYGTDYFTKKIIPKEQTDWVAEYKGGFDPNTGKLSDADSAFEITWFIAEGTKREDDIFEQWKPIVPVPYSYIELKNKAIGEEVLALQARLKELGYYSANLTAMYDKKTTSSMKVFEKANGLKADGNASLDDQTLIFSQDAIPKLTPTPKPTKVPTPTPKPSSTQTPELIEESGNITKKNNKDFQDILRLENSDIVNIKRFAEKYDGRTIEFDGYTVYVTNHGNYKTRFDYYIHPGDFKDYSSDVLGPFFKIEDVNYSDLNLTGPNVPDSFGIALDIHLTAVIVGYDQTDIVIMLEPVSIEMR